MNVEDATVEDVSSCMNVNFFGAICVVKAVVPAMRRRGAGRVIGLSSVAGLIGLPFYGASIDPKLCRSIRGWPSGPQKKKTEHEAQHVPPVDAHFRIRIDQGHPIRPILDSTRFMTDQIGRNARTGRLRFQPRERDLVMPHEYGARTVTADQRKRFHGEQVPKKRQPCGIKNVGSITCVLRPTVAKQ